MSLLDITQYMFSIKDFEMWTILTMQNLTNKVYSFIQNENIFFSIIFKPDVFYIKEFSVSIQNCRGIILENSVKNSSFIPLLDQYILLIHSEIKIGLFILC